jgi:hypothetical protein
MMIEVRMMIIWTLRVVMVKHPRQHIVSDEKCTLDQNNNNIGWAPLMMMGVRVEVVYLHYAFPVDGICVYMRVCLPILTERVLMQHVGV